MKTFKAGMSRVLPSIQNTLLTNDMFGHPIRVNFEPNVYEKKSVCGGIFSLIIMSFMVMFVTTNIAKLQNPTSSDQKIMNNDRDLKALGDVKLKDTNLLIFYSIRKYSN